MAKIDNPTPLKVLDCFGRSFACACGKTHLIDPREVLYAEDAVSRLPETCGRLLSGRRVAALMDRRTRGVAGDRIVESLANGGFTVERHLVADRPDGRWPVCDETAKQDLEARIGEPAWILAVGSGVINDLGKWLAGDRAIPYVSYATAASMNGYTSANVAATIQGAKSLWRARPPRLVCSDPHVLLHAPYELTAAGLGDVLAKSVSTTDWYLNHRLFGDYYCARSAAMIEEIEPRVLGQAAALQRREPRAMETLFHALLLTGVSMTMAETSAPASGAEHMISHTLDMMAMLDGSPHDLHGRQVGLGTVLASALYRRVLAVEDPVFHPPQGEVDLAFWGRTGPVVSAQYRGKLERLQAVRDRLSSAEAWDELRQALAPRLHRPEEIRDCLLRAGGATRARDIGCSRARLSRALLHAHEIRSRFTLLDLAHLLGVMPGAAEEIIEEWA